MPPKAATPKSTPTKKTAAKPSPREVAVTKKAPTSSSPSSNWSVALKPKSAYVEYYLIAYNVVSALLWGSILFRLVLHLIDGKTGFYLDLKHLVGLGFGSGEVLKARMGTGAKVFGEQTKWVQTLALLELVHAGLGFVRSSLVTTAAQVSSRIFMVWWICERFAVVTHSPIYTSMVFAWSFTEIIRYSFYAVNLLNVKLPELEWLRYNTFWLLYPLGAGSEALLVYLSAPYAQTAYGTPGLVATYVLVAFWPVALAYLMFHMNKQRVKHAKSNKGKKGRKALKNSVDSDAEVFDTPARSTRSKKHL